MQEEQERHLKHRLTLICSRINAGVHVCLSGSGCRQEASLGLMSFCWCESRCLQVISVHESRSSLTSLEDTCRVTTFQTLFLNLRCLFSLVSLYSFKSQSKSLNSTEILSFHPSIHFLGGCWSLLVGEGGVLPKQVASLLHVRVSSLGV